MTLRIMVVVCCASLIACSSPAGKKASKPKQVSAVGSSLAAMNDQVRMWGVIPVYPPREDIFVGDILVHQADADTWKREVMAGKPPPHTFRVRATNVQSALDAYYGQRPEFSSSPVSDEGGLLFGKGLRRLRSVAFPTLSSYGVRGGWLEAKVPIPLLAISGGLSAKKNIGVSLAAKEVGSIGLPISDAVFKPYMKLENGERRLLLDPYKATGLSNAELADLLPDGNASRCANYFPRGDLGPKECQLTVSLVTEVFYAKTLDTTVYADSRIDAKVAVGISAGLGDAARAVIGEVHKVTGDTRDVARAAVPADIADKLKDKADAEKIVDQIDQALRKRTDGLTTAASLLADALGLPKSNGNVLAAGYYQASGNSVSLRETYARPVAVGIRTLSVHVGLLGRQLVVTPADPHEVAPAAPANVE